MKYDVNTLEVAAAVDADRGNVWHHLTQHRAYKDKPPPMIVAGSGMRLTDANGNEHLDAAAGGLWTR